MKTSSEPVHRLLAAGTKFLFILPLVMFTCNLRAQENKSVFTSSSFQLDAGSIQIKEENLMPKVHRGLQYTLTYEHNKQKKNLTAFNVALGISRLKTSYEDLSPSANIQLRGTFRYLFEVIQNNQFTYYLGPETGLGYDFSYFPNWDDSHMYWVSNLSLGIRNTFTFQVNARQSLVADAGISLFSFFSRPEPDRQYKIDDISMGGILENLHSNAQAGTLNQSVFLYIRAEYQFHTGEHITQAICYSYDFNRVKSKEGFPFQENIHQIGLKIYF
jgi:hypothetical protein